MDEVNARRLTALIYREYLDPGYLVPPDKIVIADINELASRAACLASSFTPAPATG